MTTNDATTTMPVIEKQAEFLAKIETGGSLQSNRFEPQTLADAMRLADMIARSEMAPTGLRNKAPDVLLVMMRGAELNLTVLQSLNSLHVINGKVGMSADLIVGRVKAHRLCRYFRLVESSDTKATYETLREGDPEPTRMTFTLDDAKRMGVLGKDNWKMHTPDMLRARCKAKLSRAVYEDVVGGYYTPEELAEAPREEERDVTPRPTVAPASKLDAIVAAAKPVQTPEPPPNDHDETPISSETVAKLIADSGDEEALRKLVLEKYESTLEYLPQFLLADLQAAMRS